MQGLGVPACFLLECCYLIYIYILPVTVSCQLVYKQRVRQPTSVALGLLCDQYL
jgi:hypothetical protein